MFKVYCAGITTLFIMQFAIAQPCFTEARSIRTQTEFIKAIKNDPLKKMVSLQTLIPGIVIDMRYATNNNFLNTVLYRHPVAYLHIAPANALVKVQQILKSSGLGLKIYDAFRPFNVTCMMWRLTPDRHFVANPRNGSNHNRGLAVDLTLVNLNTGKDLDMGTGFDNFSDSANHSFQALSQTALANRRTLRNVMIKAGFSSLQAEWWHYSWHNDDDYEIIDLDFDDITVLKYIMK